MTVQQLSDTDAKSPKPVTLVSGGIGNLSTRLAHGRSEIQRAQRIRYEVFYEELAAKPSWWNRITRRDQDRYDDSCDHLLVIDEALSCASRIVGTQRFHVATRNSGPDSFYSANEFDISNLMNSHREKRFMELGRSCILPEYRNRRTMELLWHGTWHYALQNSADVMFGCASFQTMNPENIADELGFLAGIDIGEEWKVDNAASNGIDLREFANKRIDPRTAVRKLPPLIKGYLRLGAGFSSVAVCDGEFGTIDVLVILPLASINPRYIAHYGSDAARHRR